MFYLIKFILAFCSIAYELLLAQSLAAFLDNTVLRYSITIGLYMFSMGLGSLAVGRLCKKGPFLSLLKIEGFLTIVGGLCLVWLHFLDILGLPRIVFAFFAHVLIIVIGFLTGFETPLIMDMISGKKKDRENVVLAFDYLGALTGTLVFAFIFYPVMGLMPAAFLTGALNALAGILFLTRKKQIIGDAVFNFKKALGFQIGLVVLMLGILVYASQINEFFIQQYLH